MFRTSSRLTIGALVVCLGGAPFGGIAFASESTLRETTPTPPAVVSSGSAAYAPGLPGSTGLVPPSRFTVSDEMLAAHGLFEAGAASLALEQRGRYRGRRSRWNDNRAAQTAIILGGVASIAGAAILVYANRPECRTNQFANGCGYGSKVVGGAVLSGGLVSITLGAVTWR